MCLKSLLTSDTRVSLSGGLPPAARLHPICQTYCHTKREWTGPRKRRNAIQAVLCDMRIAHVDVAMTRDDDVKNLI